MSTKTKIFLIILWVLLAVFIVSYLTVTLNHTDGNDASALVPVGVSLPEPEKSSESSVSSQVSSESQSESPSSQSSSSSQSAQSSKASSSSQSSVSMPASGFTKAQFDSIKMGMTYREVTNAIGETGTTVKNGITGSNIEHYEWKLSGEVVYIFASFHDGKLRQKKASYSDQYLIKEANTAKYNQVKKGMSYDEVRVIFGFDGSLLSENLLGEKHLMQTYCWRGPEGYSYANITFYDGVVSTMAQYNLK